MLKKTLASSLAITSFMVFGVAHADTVLQDIQLRAAVPSGTSYVKAVGGWPADAVNFNYDDATQKLRDPQPIGLRMKSSQGADTGGVIQASLSYPTILSDGVAADDMPVDVTITGSALQAPVVLSITPQEIYNDKAGAEVAGMLAMHINDKAPAPKAGMAYQGTVALVFDFQPAPAGPVTGS